MSRRQGPARWRYRGHDPLLKLVVKIANETGHDPQAVAEHLDQAIDAGLLRITPRGIEAVVPGEDTE